MDRAVRAMMKQCLPARMAPRIVVAVTGIVVLALSALLTLSLYYRIRLPLPIREDAWLDITNGALILTWYSVPVMDGAMAVCYLERNPIPGFHAWPQLDDLGAGSWTVLCPLWIVLVLIAGLGAGVIVCGRGAASVGSCQRCGYDLTGNVSGTCPECGKILESVLDSA